MSIGLDNILNQTFNLSTPNMQNTKKDKAGSAQFTISDLDELDAVEEKTVQCAMLPQGIGMTTEQLLARQSARTAPILFDFAELYEQAGIDVKWTYDENGNRVCGMYDDTPANRAALMNLMAYMDQATQEFAKNAANTQYAHAYALNTSWSEWYAQGSHKS
jgi:hypothetical protein